MRSQGKKRKMKKMKILTRRTKILMMDQNLEVSWIS